MDLTLYKVGASGRVALGALAGNVEYFNAAKDEQTGVVTLTPVRIVTGSTKQADDTSTELTAVTDPDGDPFN